MAPRKIIAINVFFYQPANSIIVNVRRTPKVGAAKHYTNPSAESLIRLSMVADLRVKDHANGHLRVYQDGWGWHD